MNLQSIFDAVVMSGDTVTVEFPDRKNYESFRVTLLRKYSNYRKLCQQAGIESYDQQFLSCSLRSDSYLAESFVGTFKLAWKKESKRAPRDYQALKL